VVAALNVAANQPQIMTGDGCLGFLSGKFGFNLCGSSGLAVVVDGSSNLVNWTPLFTNTAPGATPFYFGDPYWSQYPARFYRARLP
jgi:hypothetical protein